MLSNLEQDSTKMFFKNVEKLNSDFFTQIDKNLEEINKR
jgi:hypothetical protein